ncbi:MAG: sulfate transporter CysZ [Magnetococcales bacterium]|nr:sulfate transporter CysZ [Magnetococcales bacterium]
MAPVRGAFYFFQGLRLVFQPGLRRFVFIPLLVNSILFALGVWYGVGRVQAMLGWAATFLPTWLHWLNWLLGPFFILSMVLVFFSMFTAVANLLASPFNSRLSAEVEGAITGVKPLSEDPGHVIFNEIEKIFYFSKWLVWFFILFFVPIANTLLAPLWFVFSAWMLAVEYGDYPMANHGLDGRAVRRHLRRHWPVSLGFGAAILVTMMVPLLNCLVMPAAVAGATLFWLKTINATVHPES